MSQLKNIGVSVHQRLKNVAKDSGRSFNDLAQYYALERWLYRMSKSRHAHLFVLKGALMLVAWRAPILRATRDIDLLARIKNDLAAGNDIRLSRRRFARSTRSHFRTQRNARPARTTGICSGLRA